MTSKVTPAFSTIRAQDEEWARIARELHDSTAQSVAALSYQLAAAIRDCTDPALCVRLREMRELARTILEEVRSMAHAMHPHVLDDLGLESALAWLVRKSGDHTGVDVQLDTTRGPIPAVLSRQRAPRLPSSGELKMSSDLIRVILVDDHAVVRAGLKAVLGAAKDIDVIGEASNGRDAVAAVDRLKPDVVVMDLSMPEMDGLAATKVLTASGRDVRVLILTMHAEDEYLVTLLEAGASGYLLKSAADRELIDAVRMVAHGDTYVQPSAARALARGLRKKETQADDRERYARLTERERDVLRLVASGFSAPEIGEKLFISPKTVDTYKQRIGEKLGLAHRSEYVQFALKIGILKE